MLDKCTVNLLYSWIAVHLRPNNRGDQALEFKKGESKPPFYNQSELTAINPNPVTSLL